MNIKSHQNKLIECFSIFLYLLSMVYISEGSSCDNFSKCVPLERCSLFYQMMHRSDLTLAEKSTIRQSICDKKTRSVCCPIDLPNQSECGIYYPSPNRILGGQYTGLEEFPWMVLIKLKGNSFLDQFCGGSLINKRYVLTAAHCTKYKIQKWYSEVIKDFNIDSVLLGEWDKTTLRDCVNDICSNPPVEIKVEKVITHEDYTLETTSVADIALLRLVEEVQYTKYIQPICLPIQDSLRNEFFDEPTTLTVVGWGKTEYGTSSTRKKLAVLPSFNKKKCYRKYSIDIKKQMCAGGQHNVNSCNGDSGGPLLALNYENINNARYYIAGIVSYGTSTCGLRGEPSVFTRVGAYIEWILQKIQP